MKIQIPPKLLQRIKERNAQIKNLQQLNEEAMTSFLEGQNIPAKVELHFDAQKGIITATKTK